MNSPVAIGLRHCSLWVIGAMTLSSACTSLPLIEPHQTLPSNRSQAGISKPVGTASTDEIVDSIPAHWQTLDMPEAGFVIAYPDEYLLVEPTEQQTAAYDPRPSHQILFQLPDLAQGDTAAWELPQFAIRLYENTEGLPVENWLQRYRSTAQRSEWELTPVMVDSIEGVQACSPLLMAPNCFIYFVQRGWLIEIVSLGGYSEEMLAYWRWKR